MYKLQWIFTIGSRWQQHCLQLKQSARWIGIAIGFYLNWFRVSAYLCAGSCEIFNYETPGYWVVERRWRYAMLEYPTTGLFEHCWWRDTRELVSVRLAIAVLLVVEAFARWEYFFLEIYELAELLFCSVYFCFHVQLLFVKRSRLLGHDGFLLSCDDIDNVPILSLTKQSVLTVDPTFNDSSREKHSQFPFEVFRIKYSPFMLFDRYFLFYYGQPGMVICCHCGLCRAGEKNLSWPCLIAISCCAVSWPSRICSFALPLTSTVAFGNVACSSEKASCSPLLSTVI